jgi:hypothetical protein
LTPLILSIRRTYLFIVLVLCFALAPVALAPVALADGATPAPILVPRLAPPPIPHPTVLAPEVIADYLQSPPPSALEADAYDGDQLQEAPGRGIHQTADEIGSGITLYPSTTVCSDFNRRAQWSTRRTGSWDAVYGGWAPFAVDNDYYHAENVVFAQELVVGPGRSYAANQSSLKIASSQPYAAGYGSPLLGIRAGATVTVTVRYLIWDHDTNGMDLDWASMGVKPDAVGGKATYVNGYVRGRWAVLQQTFQVGSSGQVMVLLQAQSPAALNSNIYFDDVTIQVNNRYLGRCF